MGRLKTCPTFGVVAESVVRSGDRFQILKLAKIVDFLIVDQIGGRL